MRDWVKAFHPLTLLEAMKKACSMELAAPRSKFPSKFSSNKDSKFPHKKHEKSDFKNKFSMGKNQESLNDLRRKNLCFWCKAPYTPEHECPMRHKAKAKQMEWVYEHEDNSNFSDQQTDHDDIESEKPSKASETESKGKRTTMCITSLHCEDSFQMRGIIAGQRVITLFDTGETHNFIDEKLVARPGIQKQDFEGVRVRVADGFALTCNKILLISLCI